MAKLSTPQTEVMSLIDLAQGFGITGARLTVTSEDFLPVVYIALKDLKVDPGYQRLINLNFIAKQKAFDATLVKPLSVFRRPNGDLFVADGQHTACLAAVYVKDHPDFKIPCQIQNHPSHFTTDQCEKAEAEYFKKFNFLRNNMGAIEKLRTDIRAGVDSALKIEQQLISLGVHIQCIGDVNGQEIFGYKQLKTALGKYKMTYTKKAVELCKKHVNSGQWLRPLDGSMILGLAAAYHLDDTYVGEGKKSESFNHFLEDNITVESVEEYKNKTAGQLQDVLILEKIITLYNTCVKLKKEAGPKIGTTEKNNLFDQWREDAIHYPKNKTNNDNENS